MNLEDTALQMALQLKVIEEWWEHAKGEPFPEDWTVTQKLQALQRVLQLGGVGLDAVKKFSNEVAELEEKVSKAKASISRDEAKIHESTAKIKASKDAKQKGAGNELYDETLTQVRRENPDNPDSLFR